MALCGRFGDKLDCYLCVEDSHRSARFPVIILSIFPIMVPKPASNGYSSAILLYVCVIHSSGHHLAFNFPPFWAKPFRKASRTRPPRWLRSRRMFQNTKSRGLPPTAGPPPRSRLVSCRSLHEHGNSDRRRYKNTRRFSVTCLAWQSSCHVYDQYKQPATGW